MRPLRLFFVVICLVFSLTNQEVAAQPSDVSDNPSEHSVQDLDSEAGTRIDDKLEIDNSPTPPDIPSHLNIPDVDVDANDDLTYLNQLLEKSQDALNSLDAKLLHINAERTTFERVIATLNSQSDGTDEHHVHTAVFFSQSIAHHTVAIAVLSAKFDATSSAITSWQNFLPQLQTRIEELEARAEIEREEARRIHEAESAQRSAREALEQVLVREQSERNEQLRALLLRERQLAEELLRVATAEHEQLRTLQDQRHQRTRQFAEQREVILAQMEPVLSDATPLKQPTDEFDLLFADLRTLRSEARSLVKESWQQVQQAKTQASQAQHSLAEAQASLRRAEQHLAGIEATELAHRQRSLAQLRLQLREREFHMADDVAQATMQGFRQAQEQEVFFNQMLEQLLPIITSELRSGFLSPFRDNNWVDARDSIFITFVKLSVATDERIQQAKSLPSRVTSIEFWSWIIGLLLRLAAIPFVIFVGREYNDQIVKKITDFLLKNSLFRKHLEFTVKLAASLKAVLLPLLAYIALSMTITYAEGALVEAQYIRWLVDACFLYWILTSLTRVLFLPRIFQESSHLPESVNLDSLTMRFGDKFNLTIARAKKIILSVRITLIFGLFSFYTPIFLHEITGYTTIWYVGTRLAQWGLVAAIYYVLHQWKDSIADMFERLAADRLPTAVYLVNHHKDKAYGVLLIALASLYVITQEVYRIARAYVVDTRWSRRVSNFIFRKKIELQQRDVPIDSDQLSPSAEKVPASYRTHFVDFALTDEPYLQDCSPNIEPIIEALKRWRETSKKGTVAVIGEPGIGKTTLLNQLYHRWEACDEPGLTYVGFFTKVTHLHNAYEFLSNLFKLSTPLHDRDALVAAIRDQPQRLVLVDDCHLLFIRKIGGFDALNLFLEVVKLTNDRHFWVLSFNSFAWSYLNRVQDRRHRFAAIVKLRDWTELEIQQLILSRDAMSELPISFSELIVATESSDRQYEIVKTANGYFRLLHEFSRGNPRVAMAYWLRSLRLTHEQKLEVSLFRRPVPIQFSDLADNHRFALAAIAQHGHLNADEIAEVINTPANFCDMTLHFFEESDIVSLGRHGMRASLAPLYFRAILKQLGDANFLYE